MRIAIAGTHVSGKTTLAEALVERLKGYSLVEEPYHQLVADGYEFADVPSVDDFAEQLRVSVETICESGENTVFDRSPLDFIAYALCVDEEDAVDRDDLLATAREGLACLDAIVFCPVESPDLIPVPRSEDRKLRSAVDHRLRDLIVEDAWGVLGGMHVLVVTASVDKRVAQILADLKLSPRDAPVRSR